MSYEDDESAYLSQYQPFTGENDMYEIGEVYEIGYDHTRQGFGFSGAPYAQYAIGAPMSQMLQAHPAMASLVQQGGLMPVAPQSTVQGTLPPMPPMGRGPMIVKKKDPDQARLFPLGMNSASTIAAGTSSLPGDVSVQPQEVCKPRRWSISPSIAPDFLVNSLVVGVKPQTPANSAMSAEAFLPNCQFSDIDFDTCQISQQIAAIVTNINAAAARQFLSTFYVYVAR